MYVWYITGILLLQPLYVLFTVEMPEGESTEHKLQGKMTSYYCTEFETQRMRALCSVYTLDTVHVKETSNLVLPFLFCFVSGLFFF